MRDERESLLRQRGFIPPEYESLPFPESLNYLWEWFLELNRTRGSNGFGLNSISYQDIDAWSRLTRRKPTALDVYALTQLDAAFLAAQNSNKTKKGK